MRTVALGAGLALPVYLAILWGFQLSPLRAALGRSDFANFYDLQARQLLHGHLSVPRGSLGIEGFVQRGHEFMYFPPGPALARMPLFLFTSRFDGRLTAISMLLAWCATVVLFAMVIWRLRRILRGKAPLPRWEATCYGLLVIAGTTGSVLLYLASMPWVYHEAYAWSIATSLLGVFALLGVVQDPQPRRVLLCGIAVLSAVLVRATTGWAMGLGTIATAIWFLWGGHSVQAARYGRLLLLAAVAPLLLGASINYAKFEHPYMFRLEDQVWTSVNAQRRAALAENGPDMAGLDLLPTTAINYFRPDGIRFVPIPPFVTFPQQAAQGHFGAYLDQSYRTGSAVPFMPALVGLGTWGLVTAFRPRGPSRAAWIRIPILASGAIAGAMMIYGYIAYRYLAEVLPVLLVTSAVGLIDLGHLFWLRGHRDRRRFVRVLAGLTVWGVAANAAVSITAQSLANPGPMLDRYLDLQERVSALTPGDPLTGMVSQGDTLPARADGEHLYILGDCDALLVGQAEDFWPWVPTEIRTSELVVTLGDDLAGSVTGTGVPVPLARPMGRRGLLSLELAGRSFLVHYRSATQDLTSTLGHFDGRELRVEVVAQIDRSQHMVRVDGEDLLAVPLDEVDSNWFRSPNLFVPAEENTAAVASGIVVTTVETEPPPRCRALLERLR